MPEGVVAADVVEIGELGVAVRGSAAEAKGPRLERAAALKVELGALKSIALTAPYLGLAGTCVGILHALGGASMQRDAFRVIVATELAAALIPTAAVIPVAVLATCSFNYLRTRIDLLEGEVFGKGQQRILHFRGTRRFAPRSVFRNSLRLGYSQRPYWPLSWRGV